MTIREEINEVKRLHDEYSIVRYTDDEPLELINKFNLWHGKAAALFSRYLTSNDSDLQKFINIEHGNSYVLASQFDEIETPFNILIDKLENSVIIKLEQLICEGEEIVGTIKYVTPQSNVLRTFDVYSIGREEDYQIWKNKCLRLLELHFKKDGTSQLFKEAEANFVKHYNTPKYIQDMIGVLKACVEMPSVAEEKTNEAPIVPSTVTVNVNQNQTQSQSIVVDIFLESIKDEIPGKYFKELKSIASEEQDPVKAKSRILGKVKSFGEDVLSNIVASIITNPTIWGGLV